MKHKEVKDRKEKFVLEDGDLLVMQGTTQKEWLHAGTLGSSAITGNRCLKLLIAPSSKKGNCITADQHNISEGNKRSWNEQLL